MNDTPDSRQQPFHGHGKLLLSAEYFVLDGALALALPLKPGQSLHILPHLQPGLHWNSFDHEGNCWFSAVFQLSDFFIKKSNNPAIAATLKGILQQTRLLNPGFLLEIHGIQAETRLDFPREWGLGTSSTLLHNLANWANVDAFGLLEQTFGGSGYDLACAAADSPILYQKKDNKPVWESCSFDPPFKENLYFVYLGKKQNSREGIALYKSKKAALQGKIPEISQLTKAMVSCRKLEDFEKILLEHELLVARNLGLSRAQDLYFPDFPGVVKSLGAWGGDFVLVTSNRDAAATKSYFSGLGFEVFLGYGDLVV